MFFGGLIVTALAINAKKQEQHADGSASAAVHLG